MPVCHSCQLENPQERDFCECGEYLRWEATGEHTAQPSPSPSAPPAPRPAPVAPAPRPRTRSRTRRREREPRGGVALSLGVPGEALGAGEAVEVTADPGGETQIVALVRNRGELVDHYELRVDGIPAEWWTTDPHRLLLNPFGSSGDYEGTLTIRLRPPRSAAARAGAWPLRIQAVSCETSAAPAEAAAVLHVRPYAECTAALAPAVASGRRRGRFTLTVENRGNAPADVAVSPGPGEDDCVVACEPERLTVPPGGRASARLTASPRRQIWIGRTKERQVEAVASPVGAPAPPSCHGRYRQRAWLPWWVPPVALPLAAAALALFMLWPRTATVPDLQGARSPFEAQKRLQRAGLKLDPTERGERSAKGPPGAVIEQDPPAGTEVRRGTAITVLVALGSGLHEVPSVVGMTIADADAALADHFKLGTWQPQDAESTDVIRSQWPEAGERRHAGTPVNVTVEQGDAAAPAAVPPAGGGKPDGDGDGKSEPSGGAPGQALVFDDGKDLFLARPGETPERLSTDGKATEASYTPDGSRIVYMRWSGDRGQVWIFSPDAGDYPGRPLSRGAGDYHRPGVSPDGSAVAFVDQAAGSVCLTPTDGAPERMRCTTDARWSYERLTWSADGLLVVARARQAGAGEGLVRYRLGSTASAATWRPADARMALRLPDAQRVAVSPDGATVAVTSGSPGRPGAVRLLTPQGARLVPAPGSPRGLSACGVAFTADGRLTVSTGPCGHGRIMVVEPDGGSTAVGQGGSPAWQPEPGAEG